MSEFSLKFRGVRGSYPVANKDYLQYGGNTACVEVHAGKHLIILDAGTGIINTGNELMEEYITSSVTPEERISVKATILLSHIHQDHIQGFTFFRPLHVKNTNINVFGHVSENEDLENELSGMLFGKTFPLELGDVVGNLHIHNLTDNETIVLKDNSDLIIVKNEDELEISENDVVITSYKSYTHPQDGVVIYKIIYKGKSIVYATDKESYFGGDKKFANFARNCNILIHDSQYTTEDYLNPCSPKQGYGHSTFDMAYDIQKQTNAEKIIFFHYDPCYNDEKLNYIKEKYPSAIMAKENLEIDLI